VIDFEKNGKNKKNGKNAHSGPIPAVMPLIFTGDDPKFRFLRPKYIICIHFHEVL